MYSIYCDESWTVLNSGGVKPYIVFYGVMVDGAVEPRVLERICDFKKRRGLHPDNGRPVEVKWEKAESEFKEAQKRGCKNRYEDFLDIFFDEIRNKSLSFAYMFLDKREYDRVQPGFLEKQDDNKQNFFFMLYFQFLYHCFIKHQVGQKPCRIFIDSRNMGASGRQYDISRLRDILNKKTYNEISPRGQPALTPELRYQIMDQITLVDLAESSHFPLVQMADLCAGCVRFILENALTPPQDSIQPPLLPGSDLHDAWDEQNGQTQLAKYFYLELRRVKNYSDIVLDLPSRHFRFCIFPFRF